MSERLKVWLVYILSAIYLALSIYLVVEKNSYAAILIPFALIICWLFLYSIDYVFYLIIFLTPFAINLADTELGIGVSLPTEPLLLAITIFFIFRIFYDNPYSSSLLRKPITIAIIFSLVWMLITCFTSEFPVVSIKYMVSRLWFVIPCYFFAYHLFFNPQNIKKVFYLYGVAVAITVLYTLVRHYLYGFTQQSGHWVMCPFYNDHTQYGAILSMIIPIFGGLTINRSVNKATRVISFLLTSLFLLAIVFSYCRASWIALIVSIGFMAIILLKIKFKLVFLIAGVILGLFFSFQDEILYRMQKNDQDSSTNFAEHLQSMYNVSTDASNLERLNRWHSAFKMFEKRPVFGWGPGTYQFCYAPFQASQDRTIISTNEGNGGNAHSEYIGPLAEQGLVGSLAFIIIASISIYLGYKTYREAETRDLKITVLTVTMALVAYYVNGVLNNFLDSDKASVPFWTFLAILAAINTSVRKGNCDDEIDGKDKSISNSKHQN